MSGLGSVHEYRGEHLLVTWDQSICRHAAECVRGLPEVFDTSKHPWVRPDAGDPVKVRAVIEKCPSRALRFQEVSAQPRTPPEDPA